MVLEWQISFCLVVQLLWQERLKLRISRVCTRVGICSFTSIFGIPIQSAASRVYQSVFSISIVKFPWLKISPRDIEERY